MFKLVTCFAVVLALAACSRNEDSASNTAAPAPPANTAAPELAPQPSASDTAAAPAPPEQPAEQPAETASGTPEQPTETAPKAADQSPPPAPKQPRKHAANAGSGSAGPDAFARWRKVQAMLDRCDTQADGDVKEQCLEKAREAYRSANIKCDALPSQARRDCLAFNQRLSSGVAEAPGNAVTHTDEPAITGTSPGDPRPAERNRDSTKQQQDARGTLQEEAK
jgi:hypothetical protein